MGTPGRKRSEESRELFLQNKKRCARCREIKSRDEFGNSSSTWDGRFSYCKPCARDASSTGARLKRTGWTDAEYQAAVEAQGGRCYICNREDSLHADHSHATGETRKLLCRKCNAGLGFFDDDPERMRRAARYVEGAL